MNDDLPFIRALLDAFLLLESSGPNEIDPDTAVRGMENMAASLLALTQADQLVLRARLEDIAQSSQEEAYAKFVRELPDMIGLARRPARSPLG
jgi:hypothetical protein